MPQYNKNIFSHQEGRDEPIKDLEGASRKIIIDRDTVGAQDITFGFSRFEANTSIHKKHTHESAEEIMYILKGKGITGIKDRETEVKAGETLWIPRGEVHWFYNPFEAPCEFLFIYTRNSLDAAKYKVLDPGQ